MYLILFLIDSVKKNFSISILFFILCFFGVAGQAYCAEKKTDDHPIEQIYYLNIARADAATVLNKLARQTDSVLIYSFEQASAYQANALYGHFTLKDALYYLLLDSGLKAKFTSNGIQISVEQKSTPVIEVPEIVTEENIVTEDVPAMEAIRITGIRSSIHKAQDIKRQSESILDVIVAEDIGKMPDITAAESIARITGVQVFRQEDEVSSIRIRGLDSFVTFFNGREFFTAEKRVASLQDFPSQALAGIEIYKLGTAEIIESGLAGIVNLKTYRPFDFDGEKIAGSLHYSYNDQSHKSSPNGNLLLSNRWKVNVGEIGFLLNATYTEADYYNGTRFNATWFPTVPSHWDISPQEYSEGGFVLPALVGVINSAGKRWRPSINFSTQWQLDNKLQLYFEGIYQGYHGKRYTDNFFVNLIDWDPVYGDPVLTNVSLVAGKIDQAASLTKTAGRQPWLYRSTSKGETNTYQYAVGGKWLGNGLEIKTDLAITDTSYIDENWSVDMAINQPTSVNVNFFADDGVIFDLDNFNETDINLYNLRGYYEAIYKVSGKGIQWRTDFTYLTNMEWLPSIQVGVRYTDRTSERQNGDRYAWLLDLNRPIKTIPFLDMQLSHNPIRSNKQGLTRFLAPTRASIANNHTALSQLAYNGLLELGERGEGWEWALNDAMNWQSARVEINPVTRFLIDEKTYSGYVQAKTYFEIKGIGIDTIIGARVSKTHTTPTGFDVIRLTGSVTPTVSDNQYTRLLPNLSIKTTLTDHLLLRFGYAKTMTRPNFSDLKSGIEIVQIINGQPDKDSSTIDLIGNSGNPKLTPYFSDNYDLSLEYYFSDFGFVSGALFNRDIDGFISSATRRVEDPQYGTINLTQPVNSKKSQVYGFELNTQMFFDFLPNFWKGFGMSANATFLKGKESNSNNSYSKIPGLSDFTYNLSLFYEYKKFASRLSLNSRSSWVNWYIGNQDQTGFIGNKTRDRQRLDMSIIYKINKSLSIYGDITNLLAEPYKNYTQYDVNSYYPQDVRDEGRYYGIGLSFSY